MFGFSQLLQCKFAAKTLAFIEQSVMLNYSQIQQKKVG